MLTMENVTALRMRRHCLTRRAGAAEYDALYRDLSPGLNVHWHGFGQPPCLVERADFDDVEYNGRRQRQRILVKGRFLLRYHQSLRAGRTARRHGGGLPPRQRRDPGGDDPRL